MQRMKRLVLMALPFSSTTRYPMRQYRKEVRALEAEGLVENRDGQWRRTTAGERALAPTVIPRVMATPMLPPAQPTPESERRASEIVPRAPALPSELTATLMARVSVKVNEALDARAAATGVSRSKAAAELLEAVLLPPRARAG